MAFGCRILPFSRGDRRQILRACRQMELIRLEDADSPGGQKQRLITAAARHRARILVLESLWQIWTRRAAVMMWALRTLARKGYAVLLVEHRLDIVLSYVDTVFPSAPGEITGLRTGENFASQAKLIRDTWNLRRSRETELDGVWNRFSQFIMWG